LKKHRFAKSRVASFQPCSEIAFIISAFIETPKRRSEFLAVSQFLRLFFQGYKRFAFFTFSFSNCWIICGVRTVISASSRTDKNKRCISSVRITTPSIGRLLDGTCLPSQSCCLYFNGRLVNSFTVKSHWTSPLQVVDNEEKAMNQALKCPKCQGEMV
jgi:hypothetical protein